MFKTKFSGHNKIWGTQIKLVEQTLNVPSDYWPDPQSIPQADGKKKSYLRLRKHFHAYSLFAFFYFKCHGLCRICGFVSTMNCEKLVNGVFPHL